MFKSSHETTSGSIDFKKEIQNNLIQAKAEGSLRVYPAKMTPTLYLLVDDNIKTNTIGTFHYPYKCMDNHNNEFWVIDLRPHRNKILKDHQGELVLNIPKDGTVAFLITKVLLEMQWNRFGPTTQLYMSDIPLKVFTKWLTGLIKKRYSIDPGTSERVQAIVAYYYLCLHVDEKDFSSKVFNQFLIRISRVFAIREDVLTSQLTELGHLGNFSDLVRSLNAIPNRSMQAITEDTLYTIIASSWMGGADNRYILNASLEFPPSFIAMVSSGATETFYRRTIINTFTEAECRRSDITAFVQSVKSAILELES